jgi:ABC-type Mn2+/Zn2+ transport system ATPase subunit
VTPPVLPMRLLTFDDLARLAREKRDRAQSPLRIAGWNRLLTVLDALTGSGAGDDLAVGRAWSLVRIRILGFQGVGVPFDLTIDPTPGITVVHGPNGSGKSSVADAVETALLGRPRPSTPASSGARAPLWDRRHCGRDAQRAHVQVTLQHGVEELVLTTRIDPDGRVVQRTVTHDDGGGPVAIHLDDGTWQSALAGHRPVFGYAALERQVQTAANLREFLEPLLAYGGCVEALKAAVDEAAAPSLAAATHFNNALYQTRDTVSTVDAERRRDDEPDLPPLTWPAIVDDPETWIAAHGLTDEAAEITEVTLGHGARIRTALDQALAAVDEAEAAETSLHARLSGPLHALHAAATTLDDPGQTCPVCGSADVAWVPSLASQLDGLVALDQLLRTARAQLRRLGDALNRDLEPIVEVLEHGVCDPEIVAAARPTFEASAVLRSHLDEHGGTPTADTRAALRAAAQALTGDAWSAAVADAANRAEHRAGWLRARRAAVLPLLRVWTAAAADGRDAESWSAARTSVGDLRNVVRAERAGTLNNLAAAAVRDLLADVGLTLTDVSVQTYQAGLHVTDESGQPVELSMLSAGQRNALLLAPLLAVAQGGPFRFLVIDDPVHALDEIRVDLLARKLYDIAQNRRVLVLTHDERLTEHLIALTPTCDVHSIERDIATGAVTTTARAAMWTVLIADARATLAEITKQPRGVTISPTDLVRGFCRMAVDAALRQLVTTAAIAHRRDVHDDLDGLDAAKRTKDRFAFVRNLYPANTALSAAEQHIAPHEGDWNRAAHGNPATSDVTSSEIDAAEVACQALETGP